MNEWNDVIEQKRVLLKDIANSLSNEEFELLTQVLQIEKDNRHLTLPHNVRESVLDAVESAIQ